MTRTRTTALALAAFAVAVTGLPGPAFAQVSGVGEGNGSTRLEACRRAIAASSSHAGVAATNAQRSVDARIFITAEVSACECEQSTTGSLSWTCIAPWRLVAMPVERH
ncbi:hypothetical protein KOAAANKH_01399 [Brevundimonas sp. NIBR10]|uniref:hypothetical protein n=1 Tax=Brevundimonas sp. NIBR10 TaxID=3015997 RepID=UPI0022F19CAA|nr:hypothetical protein [Brevundimonas sp. NIBR10]WGM46528.1 hypothetical protein KOAAANKH_01399 [Brevundimonas sp. NIBR10]